MSKPVQVVEATEPFTRTISSRSSGDVTMGSGAAVPDHPIDVRECDRTQTEANELFFNPGRPAVSDVQAHRLSESLVKINGFTNRAAARC